LKSYRLRGGEMLIELAEIKDKLEEMRKKLLELREHL
jgi:hypothetical protein